MNHYDSNTVFKLTTLKIYLILLLFPVSRTVSVILEERHSIPDIYFVYINSCILVHNIQYPKYISRIDQFASRPAYSTLGIQYPC